MGLNFTHDGDTTEVVAYVSPKKARFSTLRAEHFFRLEDIYIDVRGFCELLKIPVQVEVEGSFQYYIDSWEVWK